ncbi:MAG: hypothetical protein AABX88_00130 [Nanoarchaeota archaeon]
MRKNKDNETTRIAIIALILAIFFGIKQSIPSEKTFDFITIEVPLKVMSSIFFQIVLILVVIYTIILALNFGHNNKVKPNISGIFYDLIITLTAIIIFLTLSFVGLIWLIGNFPNCISPGLLTNGIVWVLILMCGVFFHKNLKNYWS